jgi:hypothetical protein
MYNNFFSKHFLLFLSYNLSPFYSKSSRLGMGALPGVRLTVRSSPITKRSATSFSHAIPLRPALAASGLLIFIIRGGVGWFGHSFLARAAL